MRAIQVFGLLALLVALCVGCGGKPSEAPSPEVKNDYKGSKGGPPGGVPAQTASAGIEGNYLVVGRERMGVKDTPEEIAKESEAQRTVKITKDTISFMMFKKEPEKVTYKLDPAKSPAEIDVTAEEKGEKQVLHGIYKVEGETLTLYFGTKEAKNRPKEFKTVKPDLKARKKGEEQDTGVLILILKKSSGESASAPTPPKSSPTSAPAGKSPPTAAAVGTGRSPGTSK